MWSEGTRKGKVLDGKMRIPSGTLSRNVFYLHSEDELLDSLEAHSFRVISVEKFGFGKEGSDVHRDEGLWMAVKAEKMDIR